MKKYRIVVNGKDYEVEVELLEDTNQAQSAAAPKAAPQPSAVASSPEPKAEPPKQEAAKPKASPATGEGTVSAPMPGKIKTMNVKEGDEVKEGEVLLILEAMKMENEIKSPSSGDVAKVFFSDNSAVNTGDPMISLGS